MIKEITMYTVVCDVCGNDAFESEEINCWSDKGYALDRAIDDSEYVEQNDLHYCPDCYTMCEETGKVIVTQQQTEESKQ